MNFSDQNSPEKTPYISQGAIHIHTRYSDGTGDIKGIAKAAKRAGLSWIIITDHNSLEGLQEEGWYDGVAALVGQEISPDNSDHYLALNLDQVISEKTPPEEYIKEVKRHGGIGFIAHPDESLNRNNKYRPLRWTDWSIKGFDGLEIWNGLSDWVDNYDPKKALYCYFKRNNILTGPGNKTLEWWDSLNNSENQVIPAIGGIDVHALDYKFLTFRLKIFPYYESFKTITNCLYLENKLSGSFDEAKRQIYTALKQGRNTIINRAWNKGKNEFEFYIKNLNRKSYPGESLKLDNSTEGLVKLPQKAKIRLIKDGKLLQEISTKELTIQNITSGKYRVEVYYKDHPWIFTNPVLVSE